MSEEGIKESDPRALWEINGSWAREPGRYASNIKVNVVAKNIIRAIVIVREMYPDIDIASVTKRSSSKTFFIVDDA